MKYIVAVFVFSALTACGSLEKKSIDESSFTDMTAYVYGFEAGNSAMGALKSQRLDQDIFLLGLQDALSGRPARHTLSEDEIARAIEQHNEQLAQVVEAEHRVAAETNEKEGAAFRERYAEGQAVRWLDDNIQYTVLVTGEGALHPSVGDTVELHYEGRLPDGTVFDSSMERGEPVVVDLNRVIPGWQKVVPRMVAGDEWEVVLPPEQAYGDVGREPAIGPNQTLIFKIRLIDII